MKKIIAMTLALMVKLTLGAWGGETPTGATEPKAPAVLEKRKEDGG